MDDFAYPDGLYYPVPLYDTDFIPQDTRPFVNPAAMSTPPRGNDIWSEPGSATLPSRKRDFDATNFQTPYEYSKSRRATPVPNGHRELFMPSSTHSNTSRSDVEVIDLTGYVIPPLSLFHFWTVMYPSLPHLFQSRLPLMQRADQNRSGMTTMMM